MDNSIRKGRFTVKFSPSINVLNASDIETKVTPPNTLVDMQPSNSIKNDESFNANNNLYLYETDMDKMPHISNFFNTWRMSGTHATYPSEKEEEESFKVHKKAKLGIMLGVYLPTIQHILGLLMFIRHAWIMGHCGVIEMVLMIFMCCFTTFVTAISVSAIATNGVVQAGGSYYMLTRNLGAECGGSIGICFYLANTFATCLYLLGAIEILLLYMAPSIAIFGDMHEDPWNNFRLYGTAFLIAITIIVAFGVKFVQLFAPISLLCVIVSILSIVVGAFVSNPSNKYINVCFLGERLLSVPHSSHHPNISEEHWCHKNISGNLWNRYCEVINGSITCDPYFENNEISYVPAIPGIMSGVIKRNIYSVHLAKGEVNKGVAGNKTRKEVVSDITTSFVALCAIYFPSVTGILTGVNMSGDLKDPQKSIPLGTIAAQLTSSFVYLLLALLYSATVEGAVLRDKFGGSLGGQLIAALLCWPNEWVVLVGAFSSSVGAALQCFTSAPRLLQAIARDDIIPFLRIFKVTTRFGEPLRALILTFFIAEIGILIANIDTVAPIIDVFFLMCYLFVNLICVLQTLLKMPNWRPRFKYYHWSLSIIGVGLNLALSIIAGWYYALAAFGIAAFIYIYIQYKGGEKEWGDGISGLTMSTIQKAMLSLEEEPHTKNWRPQLLVLAKFNTTTLTVNSPKMLSLAAQLKAGRGLTILATVIPGDILSNSQSSSEVEKLMKNLLDEEKVKGFSKVVISNNTSEALSMIIQSLGLGGLKHNTVMIGWPDGWKYDDPLNHDEGHAHNWNIFLDTVRVVTAKGLALLVPKNIDNFPKSVERFGEGTIDIWWIVHDGGMLILLSFLLQKHKVWKGCSIRIFTVAQINDNSIQIKNDLETFLYQIRIKAEVHVVEMYDNDISAYAVERTMDMERRVRLLKEVQKQLPITPSRARNPSLASLALRRIASVISHQGQSEQMAQNDQSLSLINNTSDESKEKAPPKNLLKRINSEQLTEMPVAGLAGTSRMSRSHESFYEGVMMKSVPFRSASEVINDNIEDNDDEDRSVMFTYSHHQAACKRNNDDVFDASTSENQARSGILMRMHTAVQLNHVLLQKSSDAQLVIINFPAPPLKLSSEENFMEYLEMMTEGLSRVLLVRGSGKEVVTIYS